MLLFIYFFDISIQNSSFNVCFSDNICVKVIGNLIFGIAYNRNMVAKDLINTDILRNREAYFNRIFQEDNGKLTTYFHHLEFRMVVCCVNI
jgi:hypothetical protein